MKADRGICDASNVGRSGDRGSRLAKERRRSLMANERLKAYRDAWNKLKDEALEEKASWGKKELKRRMDQILIECLEVYLNE